MRAMQGGPRKILLVGLGATGLAIGRALARRRDCQVVGAVDLDPRRAGTDLGLLLDGRESGRRILADVAEVERGAAEIAVVATVSRLSAFAPLAERLVERGLHVVGTAEELAYPFRSHRAAAEGLDALAREHEVAILGTGCNPGLLMDSLPLVLSALRRRVDRVEVRRTAEMSGYGPVLDKFGIGLSVAEFNAAQAEGAVIGHVGFEQSVAAVAAGLGWELDDIEVDPVRPAFVAPEPRATPLREIPRAAVTAVLHRARGIRGDRVLVDLQVHFGVFEEGDPVDPGDFWAIHGDDGPLEVHAPGGLDSLDSTVAVTANVATAVAALPPGLRSMLELPVGALAAEGTAPAAI